MANELKRDLAYKTLKRQIYSGYLMPGRRLIELDLARDLVVSRTIIREVIKQLALEGLVELAPYKGATVVRTSITDLEEIYTIQQDLEGLAAYLATSRLSERQVEELERIHRSSQEHPSGDVVGWQKWNTKFHRTFVDHCGNQRLIKLVEGHRDQFARYWFLVVSIPGCIQKNIQEHERITEAVRAQDPGLVRQLMERHVGDGARQLLEIIRSAHPSSVIL
jgi:DNA-binding GntR family transcriptional regulator